MTFSSFFVVNFHEETQFVRPVAGPHVSVNPSDQLPTSFRDIVTRQEDHIFNLLFFYVYNCLHFYWVIVYVISAEQITRRDRLKSAPYLRLKNIQTTTIENNIWKKYFFRKSHNAEKLKKRPFRLIKRFYKPKTSKKCKGLPFDRIRKFSKKSRIVPKKPKGGTLWSHLLYFWKHKNIMV